MKKTPSLSDFIIATAPKPCPICSSKHAAEINATRHIQHEGRVIKVSSEKVVEFLTSVGEQASVEDVRHHFHREHHKRRGA